MIETIAILTFSIGLAIGALSAGFAVRGKHRDLQARMLRALTMIRDEDESYKRGGAAFLHTDVRAFVDAVIEEGEAVAP